MFSTALDGAYREPGISEGIRAHVLHAYIIVYIYVDVCGNDDDDARLF